MKKYIFSYFIIIYSFCVTAQNSDTVYLPLNVGNSWHFCERWDYFDIDSIIIDTTFFIQIDSVLDTIQRFGHTYYLYQTCRYLSNRFESYKEQYFFRHDSQGNIIKLTDTMEQMWFNFNTAEYDRYSVYGFWDTVIVWGKHEIVRTPINLSEEDFFDNFEKCIQLEFDKTMADDDEVIYSFAPNIGIVSRQYGPWVSNTLFYCNINGIEYTTANLEKHRHNFKTHDLLINIYPNPSTKTTSIYYNAKKNGILRVYDISGKKVFERALTGPGTVIWDARSLGAGVYLLKVRVGERQYSKRLVLQR
jgi:hypothetical protein